MELNNVSYPQLRELKALFALAVLAGPYVSYPQLRELKGAEPMFQYVLDDVSYPQLRELKVLCQAQPAGQHGCILPAAAGIESAGPAGPGTGGPDVSYPQLRELKRPIA